MEGAKSVHDGTCTRNLRIRSPTRFFTGIGERSGQENDMTNLFRYTNNHVGHGSQKVSSTNLIISISRHLFRPDISPRVRSQVDVPHLSMLKHSKIPSGFC